MALTPRFGSSYPVTVSFRKANRGVPRRAAMIARSLMVAVLTRAIHGETIWRASRVEHMGILPRNRLFSQKGSQWTGVPVRNRHFAPAPF